MRAAASPATGSPRARPAGHARGAALRGLAIALVGVLAPHDAARAGWEATEWGMSVRKVVEVLKESGAAPRRMGYDAMVLKRMSTASNVLVLVRDYGWHGHRFEARFGFDSHGELNRVSLLAAEDRFAALEQMMAASYGEPISRAESPLPCRLWIDRARGDYVRLRHAGSIALERMPAAGHALMRCWGAERRLEGEDEGPVTTSPLGG